MKAVKTVVLVFKSGRRDKFFYTKFNDLKSMCNWENVVEIIKCEN